MLRNLLLLSILIFLLVTLFYQFIKEVLLGNIEVTLAALFLGGVLLIILEKILKEEASHIEELKNITNKRAFLIGVCQSGLWW